MNPPLEFTPPTQLRILRQTDGELLVCVKAASHWLGGLALVMMVVIFVGGIGAAIHWSLQGRLLIALEALAGMLPALGVLALFAYAMTEERLNVTGTQIETQTCLLGWCLRRKAMRFADIISMEVIDASYDEGSCFRIEFKTASASVRFGSGEERTNADRLLGWLTVRWIS